MAWTYCAPSVHFSTKFGQVRLRRLVRRRAGHRNLPQKGIADLFETTVANVNTHIRNILDESEVHADSVIKDYLITTTDGKQYLSQLNRFVTMYLDYAEDQARRGKLMVMADWAGKLDAFLAFNDRAVLQNAGKIEKKVADELAVKQFDRYQTAQRRIEAANPTSDFDHFVEGIKKIEPPKKESGDE